MAAIQARLIEAEIPFERVDAIRGASLPTPYSDVDETGHRRMTGRRRIPPEIGCCPSHIKAIDAFLRTSHTRGLFLEDDAVFAPDLTITIQEGLRFADLRDVLRQLRWSSPPTRPTATAASITGVKFYTSAGTTYRFVVDGYNAASGVISLNLAMAATAARASVGAT